MTLRATYAKSADPAKSIHQPVALNDLVCIAVAPKIDSSHWKSFHCNRVVHVFVNTLQIESFMQQ